MLLKDRKIIVTGGPTREWLDPVRFISNASTGRMGVAIADIAFKKSKNTVFIYGPVDKSIIKNRKYKLVKVESTNDMLKAVADELEDNAILIMAAAPADYMPVERSEIKIKKSDSDIVLKLKKTEDILKNVASIRERASYDGLFVVGFAAETNDTINYALGKLKSKNLDMICLNDVSQEGAGFGSDTNIVIIFKRDGTRIELPLMSKELVAQSILDEIEKEVKRR